MTRKIGWTILDAEILGSRGSARLRLALLHPSSTTESQPYIPAESVEVFIYDPEEICGFADQLKSLASELQDRKTSP